MSRKSPSQLKNLSDTLDLMTLMTHMLLLKRIFFKKCCLYATFLLSLPSNGENSLILAHPYELWQEVSSKCKPVALEIGRDTTVPNFPSGCSDSCIKFEGIMRKQDIEAMKQIRTAGEMLDYLSAK